MSETLTQIRGLEVISTGTYVLLDDVVTAIREYAQSQDDPNAGALLHDLATWLDTGKDTRHVTPEYGHSADDWVMSEVEVTEDPVFDLIYRVELYPDPPDDPRPKWYARTVDTEGNILHTTNGSFDYEYVYKNASERWPGKTLYQLNRWSDDSVFVENQEKNAHLTSAPIRERVSPKRMFA